MTALSAQSYAELVGRAQELVERYLPLGSVVAVVSRGDPALLRFRQHIGWHVPSAEDGTYLGYHPADGAAAVQAVESVRSQGADFLLVPESSSWWLKHYAGLREQLEQYGPPVVEEAGTGAVFPLSGLPSLLDREATERARVIDDLADIADLLLPAGASLVVIGDDEALVERLGDFRAVSVDPDAVSAAQLNTARFLLLPCWLFGWLEGRMDVRDVLAGQGRVVTWQQYVGAIYEFSSEGGP